jgi:hypothetical protein
MRPAGILALLGLVACGDMSSPLSVVDDLRVLDIRAEPASPAPGEVPEVTPLVFDATGEGFDTWTWWCTADDVCGREPLSPGPFVNVSVLACTPGLCTEPDDLSDPEPGLVSLPFEGVSLARRTFAISPSADVRLNDNPVWTVPPTVPETVAPGETVSIEVGAEDDPSQTLTALPFATVGEVPLAAVELEGGLAVVEWVAPDEAGEVLLAVVIEDGLGGSVQWQGSVVVR